MTFSTAPDATSPPLAISGPDISVIVPVFREERNIQPFLQRLIPIVNGIGSYEVIFCYDPSPDGTEAVIRQEIERNPNIRLLKASRRFGQPSAIMAGLHHCSGHTAVVIDVDLQDPPELIGEMYSKIQGGFDVVLAKRRKRHGGEPLIRKLMAVVGYRVISGLAQVDIPLDTGDFRMLSRRVVDTLCRLKESHGFLRGMVAFVGFKQTFIEFDRDPRAAGETNYAPTFGSIKIGLDGIIGFSTKLLTFMLLTGLGVAGLALLIGIYVVFSSLIFDIHYPLGLPTLLILVAFLGGMQLAAIGVVGEYIGRIYTEVMHRPLYIVDEFVNAPEQPPVRPTRT